MGFVDKSAFMARALQKMALIITLLCNYLIISIPRNENLPGFYLHITHSKSVVGFLSGAADRNLEVSMAKDKD